MAPRIRPRDVHPITPSRTHFSRSDAVPQPPTGVPRPCPGLVNLKQPRGVPFRGRKQDVITPCGPEQPPGRTPYHTLSHPLLTLRCCSTTSHWRSQALPRLGQPQTASGCAVPGTQPGRDNPLWPRTAPWTCTLGHPLAPTCHARMLFHNLPLAFPGLARACPTSNSLGVCRSGDATRT